MKDGKKRVKSESGRGTYARQACNHCRRRKSKCDGQEPVCGPCQDSGRAAECTWGKETAKKARTQQHFESLKNHIKGLEHRIKELETELLRYRPSPAGPSFPSEPGPSRLSSDSPQAYSVEPKAEQDEVPSPDRLEFSGSSEEESDIEHLIAPTKHLVLHEHNLEFYGPTSAFRMAPERTHNGTAHREPSASTSTHFDWARYLPPEAPLDRAEHDRCLDLLFKFFTCWCYRTVPELFYRDMQRALSVPSSETPTPTTHYSPMLHNAALAVSTAFSDDPRVCDVRFREYFAQKAKSYIEAECSKPSISVINALSLLASYHSVQGEQTLGYMYFGMSGRMSQALGLSIDCSPWVKSGLIDHADMLDRNWTYWITFTQDVCWSLYVGRNRCLTAPNKDIFVPFVDSEYDRAQWQWPASGLPPQTSFISSTFAATCSLLQIAVRVLEFVNGISTNFRQTNLQVVSELDIELNAWKDGLPPEIDLTAANRPSALPHRLALHMAYWWLFILLHRPFYRRTKLSASATVDIDHVKLVNRAAENVMLLLGIWNTNYSLRYVPITVIQIAFSAGTVSVLSAIQAISGPRLGRVALTSSLCQLEQCVEFLSISGKSWACARSVRDILLNFFNENLKPRLLLRSGDTKLSLPAPASKPASKPTTNEQKQEQNKSQPSTSSSVHSSATLPAAAAPVPAEVRYNEYHTTYPPLWPDTTRSLPPSNLPPTLPQGPSAPILNPQPPQPYIYDPFFARPRPQPQAQPQAQARAQQPPSQPLQAQNSPSPELDIDMTLTGVDLGIVGAEPISNQPYMPFGMPALGMGYQPPPLDAAVALQWSEEEQAMMDQLVRQQWSGGSQFLFPQGLFEGATP